MATETRTIVVLQAIDWGIVADQVSSRTDFLFVRGDLVGFLVREDDEKVIIAPQWFNDDGVRCTLVVPKVSIEKRHDIIFPIETWVING